MFLVQFKIDTDFDFKNPSDFDLSIHSDFESAFVAVMDNLKKSILKLKDNKDNYYFHSSIKKKVDEFVNQYENILKAMESGLSSFTCEIIDSSFDKSEEYFSIFDSYGNWGLQVSIDSIQSMSGDIYEKGLFIKK